MQHNNLSSRCTECSNTHTPALISFTTITSQFLNQRIFSFISTLCVMPLFLEALCVFWAADESQCVNGILSIGVLCVFVSVCNCVCLVGISQLFRDHHRSLYVDSFTLIET